jgi:hypothetical protein
MMTIEEPAVRRRRDDLNKARARGKLRITSDIRLILALPVSSVSGRPRAGLPQRGMMYVLATYGVSSLVLHWVAIRKPAGVHVGFSYWLDLAWFVLFIAYSGGANSVFFVLLLFPVLAASFQSGFRQGMVVSAIGAIAYGVIGSWGPQGLVLADIPLVRIVALLALGYMIARWGGHEVQTRARLRLLRRQASSVPVRQRGCHNSFHIEPHRRLLRGSVLPGHNGGGR